MSVFGKRHIMDYVQFRLVLLNEDNTVKKELFVSDTYKPSSKYGGKFNTDLYDCMVRFDKIYDFSNWESVPNMEFQARRENSDEWIYLSNPIDDFMNL